MKALDGRHRWQFMGREGAVFVHTCRVCGRTQKFESLIPDSFVDELRRSLMAPNPYRTMFR